VTISFPATVRGEVRQSGNYEYTYQLELSDGTNGEPKTVKVAMSVGAAVAPSSFSKADQPYEMTLRASVTASARMRVTNPNDVSSTQVPLSVTCVSR
jgi:hypothetical protein